MRQGSVGRLDSLSYIEKLCVQNAPVWEILGAVCGDAARVVLIKEDFKESPKKKAKGNGGKQKTVSKWIVVLSFSVEMEKIVPKNTQKAIYEECLRSGERIEEPSID